MSAPSQKVPPWKQLDLTPAQFEAARRSVLNAGPEKVTKAELAKEFGISERALRKWEALGGWAPACEFHRKELAKHDEPEVYQHVLKAVRDGKVPAMRLFYEIAKIIESGVHLGVTVDNRSSDDSLSLEEILSGSGRNGSSNGDGVDSILRRAGRR
jgi:hypothetical protein